MSSDTTTTTTTLNPADMTSKDYYFDSYSHFGIHEGMCASCQSIIHSILLLRCTTQYVLTHIRFIHFPIFQSCIIDSCL